MPYDESLTAGLDPAQAEAVVAEAHPLAVIAAAGSGKTSVLTRRIAHRVQTGTAEERHAVALTFSRQAAAELAGRMAHLGVRGVTTGTFHAVAYAVLRQRWVDTGRPAPALMVARNGLLAECTPAPTGGRRRLETGELGSELDWARAQRLTPERYAEVAKDAGRRTAVSATTIAGAMARFAERKRHRRVVDFDDLLEHSLTEMERDPEFAAQVRWRFRHFFVDEFQDVNPLQHALLEAWRGGRGDLCVVGDPRQAIYGWNGADPGLLIRVEDTYPGIRIIRLRRNYRCAPAVVAAAAGVLRAGIQTDDALAVRAEPGSISLQGAPGPDEEAALVVDRLRLLHPPTGRWSSMAVLARTNQQLEPIQAALRRAGIPAQLANRPISATDDPARRALMADARRCESSVELAAWGRDLDDGTEEVPASPLHRRIATALRSFLVGMPFGGGPAFVEWFELTGGNDDRMLERHDAVQLLTFHAAKGREWRTVAVVGVEPGLVPHAGSSRPEAYAEEVRLLYVAITRASEHLVVTWCDERNGRPTGRSPLIAGLEPTTGGLPTAAPEEVRAWRRHAPPATDPVLDALIAWRGRAAAAAALPAVAICQDDVLRSVAARRPATIDELAEVPGFGRIAATRLGPRLLAVLSELGAA